MPPIEEEELLENEVVPTEDPAAMMEEPCPDDEDTKQEEPPKDNKQIVEVDSDEDDEEEGEVKQDKKKDTPTKKRKRSADTEASYEEFRDAAALTWSVHTWSRRLRNEEDPVIDRIRKRFDLGKRDDYATAKKYIEAFMSAAKTISEALE